MSSITPKMPQVTDLWEPQLPETQRGSVGIILVEAQVGPNSPSSEGRVAVLTLVEGGPAEKDGQIRPGDLVYSINGKIVVGWPLEIIRLEVHGEAGTVCSLQFERPSTGEFITVSLPRQRPIMLEEQNPTEQEVILDTDCVDRIVDTIAKKEIQSEDDKEEINRLRHELDAALRENESLEEFQAHEVLQLSMAVGQAISERQVLEDELEAARLEAALERVQRMDTQRELQDTQRELHDMLHHAHRSRWQIGGAVGSAIHA
mmetsp:Transcript_36191/g.82488  ORF Transcript_36191/g.82488 Transcript_36191/m.82488 type:complete len:260 (-) Transcript_36191:34-813(-)|eukprot:CAMPEP_0114555042 /NCGR_PEP_ID=MMETSP0114-20121206/8537_1 /TAXON_ID=31324 /ORGANISM="Goniomonas sp, Strain m" /LENGTH=259 /DNA_ID=CAMNT_0001740139 /DNA_START=74 /DNA_END=853 /DNA_ORIENTATION=-